MELDRLPGTAGDTVFVLIYMPGLKSPCRDQLTKDSQGMDVLMLREEPDKSEVSHWGPDWLPSAQVKWYKCPQIARAMPEGGR